MPVHLLDISQHRRARTVKKIGLLLCCTDQHSASLDDSWRAKVSDLAAKSINPADDTRSAWRGPGLTRPGLAPSTFVYHFQQTTPTIMRNLFLD